VIAIDPQKQKSITNLHHAVKPAEYLEVAGDCDVFQNLSCCFACETREEKNRLVKMSERMGFV